MSRVKKKEGKVYSFWCKVSLMNDVAKISKRRRISKSQFIEEAIKNEVKYGAEINPKH